MSVSFNPCTGMYYNTCTGYQSSDGADPNLSNGATPGTPSPSSPSNRCTPSTPSSPAPASILTTPPATQTAGGASPTGPFGPAPSGVPTANSLIAGGGISGANLCDPKQIAQTGVAASQSTTQPYAPLVTNVPSPNGPVPGGTVAQQSIQNLTCGAYNPVQYLNSQGLNFTYQPINPCAPGTQLNYNPIDGIGNIPTNVASAATVNGNVTNPGAQQYNAQLTTGATQSDLSCGARVQNQLQDILGHNNACGDNVPIWARPAVTAARQAMNSMGLGNSTMAASAMESAILRTALPMAQQNAQERAQLDAQNLQNRQQALLSNQAATNAARQFNAQSIQQNTQFFTSIAANIAEQNAQRLTAISQFNAGQANSMQQFVTNLNSQRQEFNAQNQLLVDQSNVQWRRAVNTANTAGVNAANQANVQNAFNLSTTDQNLLWQQLQDEASWALTSGENAQNRLLSLVNSALNRQTALEILRHQLSAQMFSQLGSLATNLLNSTGILSGIGSGISSLFGGSNNSVNPNNFCLNDTGVPGANSSICNGGSLSQIGCSICGLGGGIAP